MVVRKKSSNSDNGASRRFVLSAKTKNNERRANIISLALAIAGVVMFLSDTSAQTGGLQAYDNYDLTGAELRNQPSSDLPTCQAACQSESHCQAYSFNKWTRQCSLKATPGLLRFDPSSIAGIAGAPPGASDAPFEIRRFTERNFISNDFRSEAAPSYDRCERICQEDQQCVGISYLNQQKMCKLFQTIDGYLDDAAAVSALKNQQKYGELRRGWLGVRIQQVTDEIADSLSLGIPHGALVAGVDENGPAKAGGIEPGDVVVKVDGREIKEVRDLPRVVADTPVGKQVDVVVIRKGKEETHRVTIGQLNDTVKVVSADAIKDAPNSENSVMQKTLGLELSRLTDDLRRRFRIRDNVNGVVVTGVDPDAPNAALDKHLAPGDVIAEVQFQVVNTPADLQRRIDELKQQGKRIAALLVANGDGEKRFVALKLQ
jgi:PDZ domain/PAN domain